MNFYMHLTTFSKTCLVNRGGHQGIRLARERVLVVGTTLSCPGSLPVLRSPVKDAIAVSYTHLTLPTNREV